MTGDLGEAPMHLYPGGQWQGCFMGSLGGSRDGVMMDGHMWNCKGDAFMEEERKNGH